MSKTNVENTIRELARENYRLYSDGFSYRPEGGELNEDERRIAEDVADGYWDNRIETEGEHDEELGITREDYRRWALESIEAAAMERAEENK